MWLTGGIFMYQRNNNIVTFEFLQKQVDNGI
jgi:hypothetical protein